jgi:CubicO group peptidase (beta-lactamase class C family)
MRRKVVRALYLLIPLVAATCGCGVKPAVTTAAKPPVVEPAKIDLHLAPDERLTSNVSGNAGVAGRWVTADDPVRIASISKLVTGIAVMRLVDQGKIDLDRDIGAYLGWQVRNPAFPDRAITMRMLLSHQSTITDAADYVLPLDGELSAVLAKPASWDTAHAPGDYFRYANLNFPLIAAVMESATEQRFDRIMAREVFAPLKLDACFNWQTSCSAGRRAQAITLLRPNGDLAKDPPLLSGAEECSFVRASDGGCDITVYKLGRNGSAFSPQGGLRISATDLLTLGKVLRDEGKPLLSAKAYAEMIRPQWTFNGTNGDDEKGAFNSFGLSVHIETDSRGQRWIGHVGEAYSLRSGLWVNPVTRETILKISTMVDEFAPVGNCLEVCP